MPILFLCSNAVICKHTWERIWIWLSHVKIQLSSLFPSYMGEMRLVFACKEPPWNGNKETSLHQPSATTKRHLRKPGSVPPQSLQNRCASLHKLTWEKCWAVGQERGSGNITLRCSFFRQLFLPLWSSSEQSGMWLHNVWHHRSGCDVKNTSLLSWSRREEGLRGRKYQLVRIILHGWWQKTVKHNWTVS